MQLFREPESVMNQSKVTDTHFYVRNQSHCVLTQQLVPQTSRVNKAANKNVNEEEMARLT